jgi:hypothetical protein
MPGEPQDLGHKTYGGAGSTASLPEGFRRGEGVASNVGVEQARRIRFRLRCVGGQVVNVEVGAGERPPIKPEPRERLRDLRPGDRVRFMRSGAVGVVIDAELVE